MNKILTICIPTYNRKEELLYQLESILKQEYAKYINIIIIDNLSDYNVEKAINDRFSKELVSCINVITNKYNITGSGNIASTFHHCLTKWMWLLGDDDQTTPGSIKTILEDIKTHDDVSMIKYSIKDFYPYSEEIAENFHEFINVYKNGKHPTGDLIFMSNNVYNLEKLKPYIGQTYKKSFSCIAQLIPIFEAFNKKDGKVLFRSYPIVSYLPPDKNKHWNFLRVEMEISSIAKHRYDSCSDEDFKSLCYILICNFSHAQIIKDCRTLPTKFKQLFAYQTIYKDTLRFSPHLKDKIYYHAFCLQMKTGLKTYGLIRKLEKYCKR